MRRRSRRTRSEAGIDIGIEMMDVGKYYDSEPAGADYATTTPWLNRTCTLTEYGARGVPNIFLTRAYMSTGDWNASHYKNAEFDSVAKTYLAAAELSAQRKATKRMAGLLLRDTPVDHRLLHQLRDGEHLEGQELRSRRHLAQFDWRRSPRHRSSARAGSAGAACRAGRSRLCLGPLTRYLLKRIGLALITLVLLSMIVFAVSTILPGNVGRAVLGPFAAQESVDALNEQLGTNRSLVVQYKDWVAGLLHGDLGTSLTKQVPGLGSARARARQLLQARLRRLHHLRPALDPRRDRRGPALRARRPTRGSRRPASRSPRCRSSCPGSSSSSSSRSGWAGCP